ncbi:peptidoglycan-binding domain-containing protein [Roseicyclus sp. F158]|uniref:Peptidoglycan-binding domain-containing protein n=1 Tax=Tropicimonas omnivorans TaxID=3075590 RepID=A0ABU3DL57_9RHOB|nr:peptidoglycan-binding domain-containing protein [Roseicyclus sp. F158]MDT0684411.1 peptidoglycan-binding domain-containing protein [Roseicyclus sp. F158]
MISRLCLVAAAGIALIHGAARADQALVLGAPEPARAGLFTGSGMPDVAQGLRDAGFTVTAGTGGRVDDMRTSLSEMLTELEDGERLVIHLTGRFVRSGRESWILADRYDLPARGDLNLATVGGVGLSLDTVLEIAGRVPGGAVLALGIEEDDLDLGRGLSEGVRLGTVPQGVTVLRGEPGDMARFVARDLTEPGRSLAASIGSVEGISADGFVSDRLIFQTEERREADTDTGSSQAEIAAEVERAIWEASEEQDTLAAYQGYIERYPRGTFATQARSAIEAIESEPNRDQRLQEEALGLSRDERRQIQQSLTVLDYEPRGIDGIFGPGTRGAVNRFQRQNGFPETGYLDRRQIERLTLQSERRQARNEAEAERRRLEAEQQDRATWDATGAGGDEAGLRTYLERYPDGLYSDIAEARLGAIEESKRAEAEGRDRAAWDQAADTATIPAYRAYLETFPEGAFNEEARSRIAALVEESSDGRREAEIAEQALPLNPITRSLVEKRLDQLGLEPGQLDGQFDDDTRRAIRRFQRDRDIEITGYLTEETLSRMLADVGQLFLGGR